VSVILVKGACHIKMIVFFFIFLIYIHTSKPLKNTKKIYQLDVFSSETLKKTKSDKGKLERLNAKFSVLGLGPNILVSITEL